MFNGTISNQLGNGVNLIAEYTGSQSAYDNLTRFNIQFYLETLQSNMAVQFAANLTYSISGDANTGSDAGYFPVGLVKCPVAGRYKIGPLQTTDGIKHLVGGGLSSPLSLLVGSTGKISIFQNDAEIATANYMMFENDLNVPSIERYSVTKCAATYVGDYANITISSKIAEKAFHKLTYRFGSKTGTIAETQDTFISWKIPSDFLEVMGNNTAQDCTIICETYDWGLYPNQMGTHNLCGTSSTAFTVMQDVNGYGPHIEFTAYAPRQGFNQYYNSISIYFDVNVNPNSDATEFERVRASCDGKYKEWIVGEGEWTNFHASSAVLDATFTNVSNSTVKIEAWDANGFYSMATYTIPGMVPYTLLTCNLITHTITPSGTTSFTVEGNCHKGILVDGKENTFSGSYMVYAKNGGDTPSFSGALEPEVSEYSNYSITIELTGLDYQTEYYVSVVVNDNMMEQNVLDSIRNQPVFDWNASNFRFNVETIHREPVLMVNSMGLNFSKVPDNPGQQVPSLEYYDKVEVLNFKSDDTTHLGYGGYQRELGATKIYGNDIDLIYNQNLTINGRGYGEQVVLWSGTALMSDTESIYLSEPISAQPNGIILVFSLYRNNKAEDVSINSFFVSKKEVELLPNAPHSFLMAINAGLSSFGAKYLYIEDQFITGHEGNTTGGTGASSITFSNGSYALRYVIGV